MTAMLASAAGDLAGPRATKRRTRLSKAVISPLIHLRATLWAGPATPFSLVIIRGAPNTRHQALAFRAVDLFKT